MPSHRKPEPEDMPAREPIKPRKHARHIEPRVRYLPVFFNGRTRAKALAKPWVCEDCGARDKTREEAEAHWTREHAPKPVVLTDMVCVSVQVEDEV
jgi:hypothetical protein